MSAIYSKIFEEVKEDFMGFTALAIILSTCLGSIAVMYVLEHGNGFLQMSQVALVVIVCNLHNASILSVQKPKIVLNLLILSVVVSLLITITNLLY